MNGDPPARQYAFGSHIAQADRGGVAVVNVYEHVSPRPIDATTRVAGLEQLAAMPLDSIPGVMPLPAWKSPPADATARSICDPTSQA